MPDDGPRERVEGNPDPARTIQPLGPSPDSPARQEAQAESDREMKRNVKDIDDRVKRAERWMIGLTFAIALFALCSVVVGILQWSAMKGQLGEMKTSGIDTHNLVDRTKDLADATKTSADAAKSAADTSALALKSNTESFELSMRPYLTASEVSFKIPMIAEKVIQIQCTLRNIGKVPASRVKGLASLIFHDNKFPMKLSVPDKELKASPDIGSIGVPVIFASSRPVPKFIVDAVADQRFTMIFYGDISYSSDVFKRTYTPLRFCFWFNPNISDFAGCRIPAYGIVTTIY